MADSAPREALGGLTHQELTALVADAWADRGWTVDSGEAGGGDVVATREGTYTERLAIVVTAPGSSIDVDAVHRAVGIRAHERADIVLLVGTDDVTDQATTVARRDTLDVKLLDGWSLCRVLDEQDLLGRVDGSTGEQGQGNAEPRGAGTAQAPDRNGAGSSGPGRSSIASGARGGDNDAAESSTASAAPGTAGAGSKAPGTAETEAAESAPSESEATESEATAEEAGGSATENETPCPSCGESIFRPLIEQGLQCPYCDTSFE